MEFNLLKKNLLRLFLECPTATPCFFKPPTINHQPPTTNHQPPTTNNQQPTTNNQQPTTNNQQPTLRIASLRVKRTNQRANAPTLETTKTSKKKKSASLRPKIHIFASLHNRNNQPPSHPATQRAIYHHACHPLQAHHQ